MIIPWRISVLLLVLSLFGLSDALARACPPRDDYEHATAWVQSNLQCERRETPQSAWIEWAEYCPDGELGFFIMKVKTGQQKQYLFERMPRSVWDGFVGASSAGKYYNVTIRGAQFRFVLSGQLRPDAPESVCLGK
jgi:hypothetical protein